MTNILLASFREHFLNVPLRIHKPFVVNNYEAFWRNRQVILRPFNPITWLHMHVGMLSGCQHCDIRNWIMLVRVSDFLSFNAHSPPIFVVLLLWSRCKKHAIIISLSLSSVCFALTSRAPCAVTLVHTWLGNQVSQLPFDQQYISKWWRQTDTGSCSFIANFLFWKISYFVTKTASIVGSMLSMIQYPADFVNL